MVLECVLSVWSVPLHLSTSLLYYSIPLYAFQGNKILCDVGSDEHQTVFKLSCLGANTNSLELLTSENSLQLVTHCLSLAFYTGVDLDQQCKTMEVGPQETFRNVMFRCLDWKDLVSMSHR